MDRLQRRKNLPIIERNQQDAWGKATTYEILIDDGGYMNWLELCVFTENFAKLLDNGIMFDRAIEVASGSMRSRGNRRFVGVLRDVFLDDLDLQKEAARYKVQVPAFYLAMLKCGQVTGRLPEALKAAGHYISELMPIKICLKRCVWFSIAAYLISMVVLWVFIRQLVVWPIVVLAGVFWLPVYVRPIRYGRDMIIANLPFIGTWARQMALMEFFLCMEIAYNSTLSVREMFDYSIAAMCNIYLREQMKKTLAQVD